MAEEKNEAVAEETPKKAPARKAAAKPAAKADAAKAEKAPAKKAPAKAAAAKADDAKADKAPAKKAPAKKAEQDVAKREPVLKVHHLRPAPGAKKDKTRVGRGEGSKARNNIRPGFEGGQLPYHMRAPKLRGFKNPFRVEYQVVNLDKLAELYPKGGDVTVADLVEKGAVRKNERVKVLGNGDIQVKLNVAVDKVSGSAEQKIVAAGGSVK